MDTAEFLEALFGDKPDGTFISLFALPGEQSKHVWSVNVAAAWCAVKATAHDVYVAPGLRRADLGPGRRGAYADVAGIVGLWADIDIRGPAHTDKKAYPPDEAAASGLLAELPRRPTLVIHSGHGLQPWWLFIEPYVFDTDEERDRTAAVARGWMGLIQQGANRHGWQVDSLADLTRVLRVPGTMNRKVAGAPVPVVAISSDGPRYAGPGDFADWIGIEGRPAVYRNGATAPTANQGGARVEAPGDPPWKKIMALRDNDPTFGLTWTRKRKDLRDQSASGYDLAIANAGVVAGWSDAEIVAASLEWRRQHGEDTSKALRDDYWHMTLGRARKDRDQQAAAGELVEIGRETEQVTDRTKALAAVSRMLGLPVARWVQHNRQNARFSLVLTDGREIQIGTASAVNSNDRFNDAVMEETGQTIPALKRVEWRGVVAALGKIRELTETMDATRRGALADWARSYLSDTVDEPPVDLWRVLDQRLPFFRDGDVFLHARELRRHVLQTCMEQVDVPDLTDMLREVGFERQRISQRRTGDRGGVAKCWYWRGARTALEPDTTGDEPSGSEREPVAAGGT